MEKENRFDGWCWVTKEQVKEVYSVLEPKAEALGGHFEILDEFPCHRCDEWDGGPGSLVNMNFRVPPELGSLIPDETGKPLVFLNVPLCRKCIIKVTADDNLRMDLVKEYVIGGYSWRSENAEPDAKGTRIRAKGDSNSRENGQRFERKGTL